MEGEQTGATFHKIPATIPAGSNGPHRGSCDTDTDTDTDYRNAKPDCQEESDFFSFVLLPLLLLSQGILTGLFLLRS